MYEKVVVPLDGSKLSESVLPHLEELARGCGIEEILLVSVTEKVKGTLPQSVAFDAASGKSEDMGQVQVASGQTVLLFSGHVSGIQEVPLTLGKMARTAFTYLHKIAKELNKKGFPSYINVLMGNPAEEIINFANEQGADLIIIASRGKSGFSRWEMGNIADKVIRASRAPVLVAKPGPDFKETKPKRKGVST